MKSELMKKMAQLHVAHTEVDLKKKDLDLALLKADKLAKRVQVLELRYIDKYKKAPDFY